MDEDRIKVILQDAIKEALGENHVEDHVFIKRMRNIHEIAEGTIIRTVIRGIVVMLFGAIGITGLLKLAAILKIGE